MKKIDPASEDKLPLSLDLFSSKPVNVAFQNTSIVEYNPVNSYGTWPTRFTINSGLTYLDLSHCYLGVTFRLRKKETTKGDDGKDVVKYVSVAEGDKISVINGIGATCIQNLKVSFNGRQVYNSNDLYAYNAYFRRRLGIETSKREDHLQLAGYFEDDEETQVSGNGFSSRKAAFMTDDFNTIAHLDVDFFKQNKILLNEMTMDIEITPHDAAFALIAQDKTTYTFSIVDMKLYIKQHHLLPQLDNQIQQRLKDNTVAKYPYTRNLMNNFFITAGRYDYKATLFNEFLPKRVFVALVDGKAFNGALGMSPFEFKSFNLQNIQLSANGKLIPAYPYDLAKKDYSRSFKDLIDSTEKTGLSYKKYLNHSMIFCFDLQSSPSDRATELQQIGNTSLSIKFSQPVPATGIQAIVYAEFDSLMAFDFARNITTALPV